MTRRLPVVFILLLLGACAFRVHPPFTRLDPPRRRLVSPPAGSNLVVNGGFEAATGEDPAGWAIHGRERPGAVLRVVKIPDAPEGERVAEITFRGEQGDYGLFIQQDVSAEPSTTYDLSLYVRGIDLVSEQNRPHGYGQQCGFSFWVLGPDRDWTKRLVPGGASPRRDGTTEWEPRRMRFTTPPATVFAPFPPGKERRIYLWLGISLYGTGTIQVDDLRIARSTASPPSPRRSPGRLALARRYGKPLFLLGLHNPPLGLTYRDVSREKIFNLTTGGGVFDEKLALGLLSLPAPGMVDSACRGRKRPESKDCSYCKVGDEEDWQCGAYHPAYLRSAGAFGTCVDEENITPELPGDLEEQVRAARRIKKLAAGLNPPGAGFYIFACDSSAAVYFNTYGWDDLAAYHASAAYDVVGTIRHGGNPPPQAVGGLMSEFFQTSINGIRQSTRRIADDVTDAAGHQVKPVWMLVNGGDGKIVTDPSDPAYPMAPHNEAELLAFRPSRHQLRYMLYAAVLNGATGLHFWQDLTDTTLTAQDPYWTQVLIPSAAEMATLERQTGFLTEADINTVPYRLTGNSTPVDSMLKRSGADWILAVANSSPEAIEGVEFVLEGKERIGGAVERLTYRHAESPRSRRLEASPAPGGGDRIPLDLPGYGVALYRFRLSPI